MDNKFKVGQRVHIKKDISSLSYCGLNNGMLEMSREQRVFTIFQPNLTYDSKHILYRLSENSYLWAEEWLVPAEVKKLKLKDFL